MRKAAPGGAAFLGFSDPSDRTGRADGPGGPGATGADRAGPERATRAGAAAFTGYLGGGLRLVVTAVLVEHLARHVGDVDGRAGAGDPHDHGDGGRGSRRHVAEFADDVGVRPAARPLA